ncbi:unnamed protein product [Lymnaea stagnalis]|uniref:Uncharacterized protein n=1 Tax=Lymnaea stagnalis TaxID=6523 RepID=A0AAV2IMG1_LYMST
MTTSITRPRTGSAKWGRPRSSSQARAVPQQSLDLDLTITGTPTPGLNPDSSRILHWPPGE